MKKQEPVNIGEALNKFFEQRKLNQANNEGQALEIWGEVVGEYIKNATEDAYIRNGVIYIKVRSAVVRTDLLMRKAYIVKQINERIGKNAVINIALR